MAAQHPAPIRIAINAIHTKTGGAVTYLRNMLPLLAAEEGFALQLFATEDALAAIGPTGPGIRVHTVSAWRGRAGLFLWEQLRLPRLLRAAGIEVTFSPANFGPLAAPGPVILLRNAVGMVGRERRMAMRLYWAALAVVTWLCLARCRRAIAVSDYARRSLAPLGFLRRRITVIPHGVSPLFRPDGEAAPADGEAPFLLAVADLYPQKNLLALIEAFAIVRTTRPNLELRIAGSRVDLNYAARLEQSVAARRLGAAVAFLGAVPPETLAALYRHCAVFVFPSTVETFGNPLVEAMASGAAIASSNTAAMPEILGDAGVYFDPDDVHDMALRIASLLDDETARRTLSRRGIERARRFSWPETARQTARLIREAAR